MRVAIFSFVILLNFIISTTWLQALSFGGILPNTTLIIVVSYALLRDDIEGAVMGFGAGLLYDMFFSPIIGISAMLMMLTGYFAGKPFRDFFKENYILAVALVAGGSLFYEFMYYVINFLLMGRTDFFRYLGIVILPTTAYNLVLCVFVYRLVYGINNMLTKREENRRGFMK